MNSASSEHDSTAPTRPSTWWLWLSAAWAVALVSTFAALFLGEVMGMTPCQLCWYQRILMFPLAVILGMAAFGNDRRGAIYAVRPYRCCLCRPAVGHTGRAAGRSRGAQGCAAVSCSAR